MVIDLTGRQFGNWTVIARGESYPSSGRQARWLCLCACGTQRLVMGLTLRKGISNSCGCLRDTFFARAAIDTSRLTEKESKRLDGWTGVIKRRAEVARRRARRRAAKHDQRYLTKYGCTFAQWREFRDMKPKPLRAFSYQKRNARTRGIEWELSFWEWWTAWQESGHWHERGRGQGYVMCRKGDVGPYALGNIFFAPAFVNSSETVCKKSNLPIGVRRIKNGYSAQRMVYGKMLHLGTYPTIGQASKAYWNVTP